MYAGERIAFALKADVFVFLWVAACVGAVSRGRFYSASDIAGAAFSPPSPAIAARSAVLQNSLEQAVLAFGAHLPSCMARSWCCFRRSWPCSL